MTQLAFLPEDYQELEAVYQRLPLAQASCIGVSATRSGEGVSTLVDALARRAQLAGHRVLVVDLNLHRPRVQHSLIGCSGWQQGEPEINRSAAGLDYLPPPADRTSLIKLKEPGYLEKWIEQWKQSYQLVLLDCSSLTRANAGNLPALRALVAADQTLLCYLAGRTPGNELRDCLEDLNRTDAVVLGLVVNDRFNPSLRSELMRQGAKVSRFFPKPFRKMGMGLLQSKWLSIRI
ncbi:tyrosine-protein kinase family protein [Aliagarivorans marinus]|uniref:tyrosine-protein kinase family protein n=1 Tax=Aliagarivorans marinus TaxID=561965 RepID=UPI000429A7A3|nr:tyrosine-protein kinase family protein [Aliagarivorans marinus]